jgi:hypothetical protein
MSRASFASWDPKRSDGRQQLRAPQQRKGRKGGLSF